MTSFCSTEVGVKIDRLIEFFFGALAVTRSIGARHKEEICG